MRSRAFGKKDKNHATICNIFRRYGYNVAETTAQGSFVDAVITTGEATTTVVEIKRREKNISLPQLEFLSNWAGLSAIVCDEETACRLAENPKAVCFSKSDKEFLTAFCVKERYAGATDKKEYSTNRILNLLEGKND